VSLAQIPDLDCVGCLRFKRAATAEPLKEAGTLCFASLPLPGPKATRRDSIAGIVLKSVAVMVQHVTDENNRVRSRFY
jgi:hypothetical protein